MEETKKTSRWNANKTQTVVMLGLLTAIVVVLQALSVGIQLGYFNVTFTLIPIIVGAALYGWKAGAWLGGVFGAVVLITGQAAGFMTLNPAGTIITVLLKGILAGLAAGLVYKLISRKSELAAVITSGIVVPVVNTGVFLLGCVMFFFNAMAAGATAEGYSSVFSYLIFFMVGGNFPLELGINLVLSTAVVYIIKLGKKMIRSSAK